MLLAETQNEWFRRAVKAGAGRILADGTERDVCFERLDADSPVHGDIDAACHARCDRYGPQIVSGVAGPATAAVTLQALPR